MSNPHTQALNSSQQQKFGSLKYANKQTV